jgi:uncharacterized protein YqjF (DUF2071 family)
MAGRLPEERVRLPVIYQRWQSLTFLHWAYEPDAVQRLLPPGLDVDTYDGAAWVGLTPFLLVRARPLGLPAVPGLSTFPETNVRTYVRDRRGVDGLWFMSLDVDALPMAVAARAFYWVPYHWATMEVHEGQTVSYSSRRRGLGSPSHEIVVRPAGPLSETTGLVDFLTGRWRAFSRMATRLVVAPVEHQPWPLHHVTVDRLDEDLVVGAGLPAPEGPPLAHYSPGVDVRLGAPRPA